MDLTEARKKCETWDSEDETCEEDFPPGCPFATECQKEAEED